MRNTRYFTLYFFILFSTYVFAQTEEEDSYDPANFIENQTAIKTDKEEAKKVDSKFSYNIEMGTSISSSSFGNFASFYTAPQVNYNFAPKLQFSAGVLIVNSGLPAFNSDENVTSSLNYTSTYLFNRVNYQATEKLRLSGEFLYGTNNLHHIVGQANTNEYIINFSAEYKINKNFSIGLQMSSSKMNTPYGYLPYSSNLFRPTNLFRNSHFSGF